MERSAAAVSSNGPDGGLDAVGLGVTVGAVLSLVLAAAVLLSLRRHRCTGTRRGGAANVELIK